MPYNHRKGELVKRNYYYLVSGLQDLFPDIQKLVLDRPAFLELLREQLHPGDYRLVEQIYLSYDNRNLLNMLLKKERPLSPLGRYSLEELTDHLREPDALPDYMATFIRAFKADEPLFPGMSPENELTTLYYDEMVQQKNTFLRQWFTFSLQVKNILTALTARQQDIPYEQQVIGTDEISVAIRKSHLRDFGLSSELDFLEKLAELVSIADFTEREKAIDLFLWDYLDEIVFFEYFTIDRILAYVIRLELVTRWLEIDPEHSRVMFDRALASLREGYELPKLFTEKK